MALCTSLQPAYHNQQWFVTPPGLAVGAATIKLEEWLRTSDPYYPARFAEVFAQQLAYKASAVARLPRQVFYSGRILVVEYGHNIPDGELEVEIAGFFDEFDLPPIDT